MARKVKLISALYTGISLVPAGLGSKVYSGDYADIVHAYGWDVALPFGLYYLNKTLGTFGSSSLLNAAYVMGGCSVFELLQKAGYYLGTFDPNDFLAYAAGTALAFGVDKLTFKKKNIDSLAEENI